MDLSAALSWSDFIKVEMRTGTIIRAEVFTSARKPAYKLEVDFGEHGIKKTSAQITKLYKPEDLINMQVIAVVNFPPKQIGNFFSECLILGSVMDDEVTLLTTERKVKNGLRIG